MKAHFTKQPQALLASICFLFATATAQEADIFELTAFEVFGSLSYSEEPASGLSTPATLLRYSPKVDLQTRGYAELQSDLTVRGSTFEQTGFRLGAVALYDPQTGHYTTEIPFAADMLTAPTLATGLRNALLGFNSNVATIAYGWAAITSRGSIEAGLGTHDLLFGQLYFAQKLSTPGWGFDLSAGRSLGDGTIAFGDFDVHRLAARLQYKQAGFQADFAAGYLDKFYGWPALYTGFASLPRETEEYQNRLFTANLRWDYGNNSFFQTGAAHREMDDDYTFDRITFLAPFEHLTRAVSASIDGEHAFSENWTLLYNSTYLKDHLVRSTTLNNGNPLTDNDFTQRDYLKAAATLRHLFELPAEQSVVLDLGLHAFKTTEDQGKLNPLLRLEYRSDLNAGNLAIFVEYAASSQVAGYTALRSSPTSGLFRGNPDLTTEESEIWETGLVYAKGSWRVGANIFHRTDTDLTDWVFALATPNARSAQAVDLETNGIELEASYRTQHYDFRASYAWLQKDADYGQAVPTASYYVLNFPIHRLTLGAALELLDTLKLSAEIEYRLAEDNVLRRSGNEALNASLALQWQAPWSPSLEFTLLVDNLFDDDFQEFPGTPTVSRHASLRAHYRW